MKTTVKSFDKQIYLTKPPKDEFWDHTDGGYDRKFVPGGVIWQYQRTGEITLKFDIDDEIDNGKFTSIEATLHNLSHHKYQEIPSTPLNIVLERNLRYQLFVISTLTEDDKRVDENWNIVFSPE